MTLRLRPPSPLALVLLAAMGCSSSGDEPVPLVQPSTPRPESTTVAQSGPLARTLQAELDSQYAKTKGLSFDELRSKHGPSYLEGPLGFDVTQASYHDEFVTSFNLSAEAQHKLTTSGFVVVPGPARVPFKGSTASHGQGPADLLYRVFAANLPVFISADSILHAFHRTFDKLMETSEQTHMAPALKQVVAQTIAGLPDDGSVVAQDARFYLAVAGALLDPKWVVPPDVEARVQEYLARIETKELVELEFMGSQTWIDFSQFEPRGHYTHTEALKRYFRAMMWLGRTDLVLTGTDWPRPREEAAARAIAGALASSPAKQDYDSLDRFYAAFVGKTNALTPVSLLGLCEKAGLPGCQGDASALASLYGQQTPPEYSGRPFSEKVAPITMRFFPQRFAYCAWVTSQTTTPRLEPAGPGGRAMAMPEDVAFVLGSDRALDYLADDMKQPMRENLPGTLEALRATMDAIPPPQLDPTVMNEWMEGLRAQSRATVDPAYPSVMRTKLWHDHKLETVLASWSELRHDTLLVVEQSSGGVACQYPKGYVEPVPQLYQALSRGAERLQQLYTQVPSPDSYLPEFFDHWKAVLARLHSLSKKELASEPMDDSDLAFLNQTVDQHLDYMGVRMFDGWYPRLYWYPGWKWNDMAGLDDDHPSAVSEPVVADVHTDLEQQVALEVATGHPGLMVIAIDNGQDRTVYGGPVSSYHTFQVPVAQRMRDDQWVSKVDTGELPARPPFADRYWAK